MTAGFETVSPHSGFSTMSSKRWRLRITFGIIGLTLVGLAVVNYLRVYCCAPIHLRISGGEVCPIRSRMARNICGEVQDAGVTLECMRGTNSETVCAQVDKGQLDLGLVLGGFPDEAYKNVRQVAAFGVDPLHLLVRRELLQAGASTPVEMLRGRRVSLGEQGTNSSILAETLMSFAGLRPGTPERAGDFQAEHLRDRDLRLMLASIRKASPENRASFLAILPDAVFQVDTLPAPLVDELVHVAGYQLVPLPYATAMRLDHRRDHGSAQGKLENSRLESVTIPAFTYGINPPVPPADYQTFGLRLLLVANKHTSTLAVLRVLRALDGEVAQKYHFNLDIGNQATEFPLHPGAAAFAKGRRPLVVGEMLEPIGNFFSVAGAAGAGALAIWGFLRGLRAVHPDVHLKQIDRIERLLRGEERDPAAPAMPRDLVDYLEARLAIVKQTAIDDYAHHRITREEALVSILTLVADTRHLLTQRRRQLDQVEIRTLDSAGRLASAA
jgi:TRAP-type uncharacterized transport system substrate-binding protein